ncbi:MAG: DUF2723 domain-containing protein [Candidatus Eisenbacteria bacterium]
MGFWRVHRDVLHPRDSASPRHAALRPHRARLLAHSVRGARGDPGQRYLSALSSSICATFLYLSTVEIHRRMRPARAGRGRTIRGVWARITGGIVAAFFTAFSRTFWDNAIEAEVYALGSAIMAIAFWLILKWAQSEGRARNMGLFSSSTISSASPWGSISGTFLVLPGILLFALLVDRRIFAPSWTGAMMVAGAVTLLHPGMLPTLGIRIYGAVFAIVLVLAVVSLVRDRLGLPPIHPSVGPRGSSPGA